MCKILVIKFIPLVIGDLVPFAIFSIWLFQACFAISGFERVHNLTTCIERDIGNQLNFIVLVLALKFQFSVLIFTNDFLYKG